MGLKPCNDKIHRKGTHLFTTHSIPAEKIEKWVKQVAQMSGQKVDWHYFGGRAVILALGNARQISKVTQAIKDLLPEHDRLMAETVGPEFADICKGYFV